MIYEIRAGKTSAIFSEYGSEFGEECCFSIVLGSSFDSIDLVAQSPEDAKVWITGIRLLTRRGRLNCNKIAAIVIVILTIKIIVMIEIMQLNVCKKIKV